MPADDQLRRGLFQAAAKPSLVVDQTPVIVVKADMLTTWPVYSPLLTSALKSTVPWHGSQNGWTTGEVKDVRTKLGDSRNGTDGEARMVVARESSVYGPSDEVSMAVEITWSGSNVIKVCVNLDNLLFGSMELIAHSRAAHPPRLRFARGDHIPNDWRGSARLTARQYNLFSERCLVEQVGELSH